MDMFGTSPCKTFNSHFIPNYCMDTITVEPPNKGHVGTRSFVLYRVVSFIWRSKCTGIILGRVDLSCIERFPLFRVSFIGGSTVLCFFSNPYVHNKLMQSRGRFVGMHTCLKILWPFSIIILGMWRGYCVGIHPVTLWWTLHLGKKCTGNTANLAWEQIQWNL